MPSRQQSGSTNFDAEALCKGVSLIAVERNESSMAFAA
jgi:hypothetical protein